MHNICFVCDGNTCRSPFAEKVMNKYLKQNNIDDFKCYSCGLNVDKNSNINNFVVEILKKYKINVKSRKPRQLTKTLTKKYDLFITMTKSQKQYIDAKNVFSFGEMVFGDDILDPYGGTMEDYTKMANIVDLYCKKLIEKIKLIKERLSWLFLRVTMPAMNLKNK